MSAPRLDLTLAAYDAEIRAVKKRLNDLQSLREDYQESLNDGVYESVKSANQREVDALEAYRDALKAEIANLARKQEDLKTNKRPWWRL